MRSMTGFGRAAESDLQAGIGFRIEISSINRKQFELKMTLPHEISFYESQLRMIVANKISRGSLTMRVDFQEGMSPDANCSVNLKTAESIIETAKTLADRCGLNKDISVTDILAIPGIMKIEPADYSADAVEKLLCSAAEKAVDSLIASRESEGKQLEKDIRFRTGLLKETLEKIVPMTAELPKQQYEKLLARIKDWDLTADHDDERLLREMVLFADKLDVTEEITRLRSHFLHLDAYLNEKHDAVGRQLDFMMQEIFREINTLGNKAACAAVSPLIVIMKTELEKIREQVQNIE